MMNGDFILGVTSGHFKQQISEPAVVVKGQPQKLEKAWCGEYDSLYEKR